MFGFVRGVRGRAAAVVLVVAALWGGVAASSVVAGPSTTVTWKVSSLTAGQVKSLSNVASSNSLGVKTWSKTGSCTLSPTSRPTTLTMGTGKSCTLTLKIAKSGKYPAKTSTKIITKKSATTTTVAPTTTTVAPTTTTTLAPVPLYSVGDTGPGGGTIFYVDLTRAVGSQYFEAACAGWSDGTCGGSDLTDPFAQWGCNGTSITGADGTAIGTGEQNTTDIVTGCATAGIAARLANDLVLGGESDWFLPSQDELNALCKWAFGDTVNAVCNNNGSGSLSLTNGGFSSDYYWSSSEQYDSLAWSQYFDYGSESNVPKNGTYYVRPVRGFSGSDVPPTTTTTTVAPTTTTVAPVPLYSVGDTGPGGGTIFYVDLTRVDGSQYFEAACAGWSDGTCGGDDDDWNDPTAQWGCYGTSISGAHGTAIGTGEQNTTDIVTGCATAGIAARLANDLVLGGESDWFLPSKDELNRMYYQRTAIGGFSTNYYWSSSEYDIYSYDAWFQLFFNPGNQFDGYRYHSFYVRPVRAFSGSDVPPTTTTTTTVAATTTTVALTCAVGGSCAVGDTGPGGGTIFYVDLTRPAGSHYFEAACAGWSDGTCGGSDLTDPEIEWGCSGTSITGADGTAIGTGEQNTTDIVTGCATAGIAAKVANDLVLGGQSDWFLPSKDELNQMYIRRTAIGGVSLYHYWSSSETEGLAWYQRFFAGNQSYDEKFYALYVRPVRAF